MRINATSNHNKSVYASYGYAAKGRLGTTYSSSATPPSSTSARGQPAPTLRRPGSPSSPSRSGSRTIRTRRHSARVRIGRREGVDRRERRRTKPGVPEHRPTDFAAQWRAEADRGLAPRVFAQLCNRVPAAGVGHSIGSGPGQKALNSMCFSGLGEERASLLRETEALAPPPSARSATMRCHDTWSKERNRRHIRSRGQRCAGRRGTPKKKKKKAAPVVVLSRKPERVLP